MSNERKPWTPGPWSADKYDTLRAPDGKQVIVYNAGIAFACSGGSAEQRANARLISKAPKMAEMLEQMVACFGDIAGSSVARAEQEIQLIEDARLLLAEIEKGNTP